MQRGVGWVPVPRQAADGTIVVTGGLNGCAIEVTRLGDHLHFYHDGDSRHLDETMREGDTVVRLTSTDHDRLDWGFRQFERHLQAGMARDYRGAYAYAHYIVGIKRAGRWEMYVTGVSEVDTTERPPLPWGNVPCLVSFAP